MNIDKEKLRQTLAQRLGVEPAELAKENVTLKQILDLSPTAINSIDIMEAFIGSLVDLGGQTDIELPAITLDDKLDDVLNTVINVTAAA
jgi:hypothetical protein